MDRDSRETSSEADKVGSAEGRESKQSLAEQDKNESRKLWTFAGSGFQFAGTVVVFYYLGHKLDQRLESGSTATLIMTFLGTVGGFYLLIKEAVRSNRE